METTFKFKLTTAMIIGGIIFLASLFSGWLTQSKDLNTVMAEHKTIAQEVVKHDVRLSITETCISLMKEDLGEVKSDIKEIRKDQIEFYKKLENKLK